MIQRIRHRGLRELHINGNPRYLDQRYTARLKRMLDRLDLAQSPQGMDIPGYALHALTGRLAGHYAVRVFGNRRLTFRFEDRHATDVDLVDYH